MLSNAHDYDDTLQKYDRDAILKNMQAISLLSQHGSNISLYLNLSRNAGSLPAVDESYLSGLINTPRFAAVVHAKLAAFFEANASVKPQAVKTFIAAAISTAAQEEKEGAIESILEEIIQKAISSAITAEFSPPSQTLSAYASDASNVEDKSNTTSTNTQEEQATVDLHTQMLEALKEADQRLSSSPTASVKPPSSQAPSRTASGTSLAPRPIQVKESKEQLDKSPLELFNAAASLLETTLEDNPSDSNVKKHLKTLGTKVLADVSKSKNLWDGEYVNLARILTLTNIGINKNTFTPEEAAEYETLAKKIMTDSFWKGLSYVMLAFLGAIVIGFALSFTLASFGVITISSSCMNIFQAIGFVTIPTDIVTKIAAVGTSLLATIATTWAVHSAFNTYSVATAPMAFHKAVLKSAAAATSSVEYIPPPIPN